ncbi:ABC-2 type transport system ATP-binding protein [Algoriphagus sp. 4150]|uniref:ABC transporter ATP-binding protein n=1 Tax=Algoriphagus sp. 4150 TaxID=2817756 RepID=UPI0028597822|nr:ATP-binding cassette domain-containing protein [Algoriphagus sp. 4150]MDR7132567.1 ABC-2 type transport system ATP-binding protein [Algoriphagus sp. 4150]
MTTPALEAIKLTKQYPKHTALQSLDLEIAQGEIFCLLGPNGAGKTTTLNLFLGFARPTSGMARIYGEKVSFGKNNTYGKVSYIPEIVQLYGNLSGLENLDFFSKLGGYHYGKRELKGFLAKAGLEEAAHDRWLSTYSKGMRQKVGISIALAKNAQVILMDEPTSGLDPKASVEFTEICKELSASGKTILMATHDIFNAVSLATRIGMMKQGRLVKLLDSKSVSAPELQKLYLEMV